VLREYDINSSVVHIVRLCFLIRWNVCVRSAARIAICTMTGHTGWAKNVKYIPAQSSFCKSDILHVVKFRYSLHNLLNFTCGIPFCVIIYSSCKLLKVVLWPTSYVVQCTEYFVAVGLNDCWIGISNYLSQWCSKLLMAIFLCQCRRFISRNGIDMFWTLICL